MSATKIGDDNAQDGLVVNGAIKVRNSSGTEVTVVDGEGVLQESAGISLADGESFNDDNGNELIEFGVTSSAVNHIKTTNAATGNDPTLEATGDDTNVNLTIQGKGTGRVTLSSEAEFNSGFQVAAVSVTPNTDDGPSSTINSYARAVDVQAVTTDANDWIVLPSLASVQVGHTIKIACNAGSNFELRTPASSNEAINSVDSDGTQEYLCTDTDTVIIWKLSDTDGWVAQSITNLGAVRTAVVPD